MGSRKLNACTCLKALAVVTFFDLNNIIHPNQCNYNNIVPSIASIVLSTTNNQPYTLPFLSFCQHFKNFLSLLHAEVEVSSPTYIVQALYSTYIVQAGAAVFNYM